VTAPAAPTSLVVPELIQGSWTSAVILTFGANLSFFEGSILRQLGQVPLRAVLSDGRRLDSTMREAASVGAPLRMVNRTYLAAPIRHSRAAHAKAILLLGPKSGQLIVGSGNLRLEGYASPGELWHVFGYQDEDARHLPEFVAVRGLIDLMAARELLNPPTIDLLQTIWGQAAWLPTTHAGPASVTHNLEVPLLSQLTDAVTWPVDELTVHAPFHDQDCAALSSLIQRFQPSSVRVLLTRSTSVDPAKLAALIESTPRASCHLAEVVTDPTTYIHAKWIHIVGARQEVLLTGSANLSRAALLRSSDSGNIEIGVISHGRHGDFASLYSHLALTPISDVSSLGLSYQSSTGDEGAPALPTVAWSRLDGTKLTLAFDRPLEGDAVSLWLVGPAGEITPKTTETQDNLVVMILSARDAGLLAEGGRITARLGSTDQEPSETWPYQLAALRGRLDRAGERDMLPRLGVLPEKDADLYALLQELEETLIFDPVSTWRVATSKPVGATPSDEGGETLRWEDLDWARVRRDPRYAGYFRQSASSAPPTDIQVVLAAISGRLGELGASVDGDPGGPAVEDESDLARAGDTETTAEDDVDEDAFEDELLRRALPISTRTRMAFNRFVDRYAAATRDEAFVTELGPIVGVSNAAIFNHLLVALLERDAVDPARAVTAQIGLWTLLWGRAGEPGLMGGLAGDEREAADKVLREAHVRETSLNALVGCVDRKLMNDQRAELRDLTQHLIVDACFGLDFELLASTAPDTVRAAALLADLQRLASPETTREVASIVLGPLGVASGQEEWRTDDVVRHAAGGPVSRIRANVLAVHSTVPNLTHEVVREALERLAVAGYLAGIPTDYLRIRFEGNGRDVGFWDSGASEGITMVDRDDQVIESFDPFWPGWLLRIEELMREGNAGSGAA
jgi:hypothetical protein